MPETKRDVQSIVNEKLSPLLRQLNEVCDEYGIRYVAVVQAFDFPPQEGDGYNISANLDPETTASALYDAYDVLMGKAVVVHMEAKEGVQ
jgi:hypothetical protein